LAAGFAFFTAIWFHERMSTLKFATWNVNGIRAREKDVLAWLQQERPDVVCLQELKSTTAQVPAALCALQGYDCYWHGARAYSGVGLHVRKDAFREPVHFYHPTFDFETRIVAAEIAGLTLISVYAPNGGKDFDAKMEFFRNLERFVTEMHGGGRRMILGGDLNIARTPQDVHPKERDDRVVGQRPEERELFESILAKGLVDIGRALDPDNENLFTWWAPWRQMRQRNIGWRLDYVLASAPLAAKAVQCSAHREVGTSDHGPVIATFNLDDQPEQAA
jgi:exodeoxyribonuclease-3